MALIPVILAGGGGHRLWPLSNRETPKIFIPLENGKTLIQETIERALLLKVTDIIIVINQAHLPLVKEQLKFIENPSTTYHFIIEPFGRNTAPAIVAALKYAQQHIDKNGSLLILPADHLIEDTEQFIKSVKESFLLDDHLIAFGALPTRPHTGYGYLEISEDDQSSFHVKQFVEKPTLEKAQEYVDSKKYLWNMGMFCFPIKILEQEMRIHAPTLMESLDKIWEQSRIESDVLFLDPLLFKDAPNISIDYGLMEKSNRIKAVSTDMGWSDMGDWQTYSSLFHKDTKNNALIGKGELLDSKNTFVYNNEEKYIGVLGVEDLVIVNHKDGILIMNASYAQKVKSLTQENKKSRPLSKKD